MVIFWLNAGQNIAPCHLSSTSASLAVGCPKYRPWIVLWCMEMQIFKGWNVIICRRNSVEERMQMRDVLILSKLVAPLIRWKALKERLNTGLSGRGNTLVVPGPNVLRHGSPTQKKLSGPCNFVCVSLQSYSAPVLS